MKNVSNVVNAPDKIPQDFANQPSNPNANNNKNTEKNHVAKLHKEAIERSEIKKSLIVNKSQFISQQVDLHSSGSISPRSDMQSYGSDLPEDKQEGRIVQPKSWTPVIRGLNSRSHLPNKKRGSDRLIAVNSGGALEGPAASLELALKHKQPSVLKKNLPIEVIMEEENNPLGVKGEGHSSEFSLSHKNLLAKSNEKQVFKKFSSPENEISPNKVKEVEGGHAAKAGEKDQAEKSYNFKLVPVTT